MIYSGKNLQEIIFPLGGIGTGSIGLAGNGCLIDWEIFNRPNKGSINPFSFFAIRADLPNGKSVTKILQGDWTKDLSGTYTKKIFKGFGFGPDKSTMCAFPHFRKVIFNGKFPIATLSFEDENFPAKVILKAFNPFIPLDADNSSIPAAFFEIKIQSHADDVNYTVMFSVRNPFEHTINKKVDAQNYTAIMMKDSTKQNTEKGYGDMTIAVNRKDALYQEYWYRGQWMDKQTVFWNDFTSNNFKNRYYNESGKEDVCSVGANQVIHKNQSDVFRFVLSWNVPNNYNYWSANASETSKDVMWKNYYATLFENSTKSCIYSLDNWDILYQKTNRFCRSLHSSTLDNAIIDAVSSTLSVLKSSAVLRLEDGTFYGWEGVHELEGSCEGTCTHVWSYVYSLCFLFPELERSLRNTELHYDTDIHGKMNFRTSLPLGYSSIDYHPCVDGQMATVIKIYRDWKITGNTQWLKSNWQTIKKVLEYAWNEHNTYEWDKNKDGVLEGRQHHTLDMEIFGPSSWLQGLYLAALKAASEMADYLEDKEKAIEYTKVFEKGFFWTKENLFNGHYFIQKVDINDKNYTEHFNCPDYWSDEHQQLKYQINEGCAIDQLLGQWHANICGLGDIFDSNQRKIALSNMFKHNFKSSFREFANMWRVFALNDEQGTVICDYPVGSHRPALPLPYSDECMTGFEYAFAGLLISEGYIEDGLKVVRAVRNRYDGQKRNPWNEIECGSNYARAMSSFSLLPLFSGLEFHLPRKHIGFSPILSGKFRCLWSLGTGWGDFIYTGSVYKIIVADGNLELESVKIGNCPLIKKVYVDGKEIVFQQAGNNILFQSTVVKKQIRFEL